MTTMAMTTGFDDTCCGLVLEDPDDWDPACEVALVPSTPHAYADTRFPQWSRPHIRQLEHLWGLTRVYCRFHNLPLMGDYDTTFADFVWALSRLNRSWKTEQAGRYAITAPLRSRRGWSDRSQEHRSAAEAPTP